MSLLTWVVIVGLILVNALYVAAEFGTVSARRSQIRQRAEQGDRLARRLLPVVQDAYRLDRYIAACQVGITLSSLVLGAYGQATLSVALTPVFARLGNMQDVAAQSTAAIVVLILLTVLHMVLGELVPKSLALQFPTRTALYTVVPVQWSLRVLSWFIKVLNGSGLAILRILGAPSIGHRHIHSPEEIDLLIAESRDGGLLEPDEHQRLRRALQLSMRSARQLMVPRMQIAAIDVDTPFEDLLRIVAESPYTRLPVYRDSIDNVIGVIHTRDVTQHYVEHGKAASLQAVLRPVLTIPGTVPADQLLALLREKRTAQAIVADEHGGVAGLVTLDDILAELMGDVADEFKTGEPQPERLPDGRVRLPGRLRLDEAAPLLGVEWKGTADTVGGRVTEALGRLPTAGERTVVDGVEIEVEHIERRAVHTIVATPVNSSGEPRHD